MPQIYSIYKKFTLLGWGQGGYQQNGGIRSSKPHPSIKAMKETGQNQFSFKVWIITKNLQEDNSAYSRRTAECQ